MLMTYLMSYVLCLIHLMYFNLMLGRVMLTCDSFALVGWTSTPKGGLYSEHTVFKAHQWDIPQIRFDVQTDSQTDKRPDL